MLGSRIVRFPTLLAVVSLLLAVPLRAQAPLATLVSPNPDNGFGSRVASIGDVNADGTPDVLVGAAAEDIGALGSAGRAYVFSGATNTLLQTLVSPNPVSPGFFGTSIAALGDVNGDSVADILIGASGETVSGQVGAGRAYVFSGATGALLRTLMSPNLASNGGFGTQVSAPGDLDGDGTDDIVVGAPRESTGL
ncbi:MAG: integrin alpha, partial [Bacteroidota bacterium]